MIRNVLKSFPMVYVLTKKNKDVIHKKDFKIINRKIIGNIIV